ncbi:MAG: hypothetical protein AAB250_06500 [Bdellovibrionota bacterium]
MIKKFIQLSIVVMILSLPVFAGGAGPAQPAQPQISNQDLERYLSETNFAECESSPGGTAIIPREQLERLIQPGGGTTTGRPAAAGGGTR